jgi:c-di-AMP phosphodiesterase-like protein
MNIGPLAGLIGAALASLSVFKWILAGFIVVMIVWMIANQKSTRNALDARAIKELVKSSAQWNTRALQDSNTLVALMNSNYALAYFNVARSIGSDADVEAYTDVRIDEFLKELEDTQSSSIQKMSMACPSVVPPGVSAVHTGWLTKTLK